MKSPLADIVEGYTDLGSRLLGRWSDHASNVAAKFDAGDYDADSAVADLAKTAALATETGVRLASEAFKAVTTLASPSGPYEVESELFESPLAGAALRPAGQFESGHGAFLPAVLIRVEPSKLDPGQKEFKLRVNATLKRAGTYVGRVEATEGGNVDSVTVWVIVP